MYLKILVAIKWLWYYLWNNRDPLISLWNEIKKDWKYSFSDLQTIYEYYEKSWFISEDEDEVFVWWITEMTENKSKNLVQYDQSSRACAIYSRTRVAMYNIKGLFYSKAEVESIVSFAKEKGYLKTTWDSKGMTFANADKAISEWTLKNKNITLKYDKVLYGWMLDKERVALWYSRSIWGWISSKYLKDFKLDWVIDQTYDYSEKILFWHAFSQEDDWLITENYPTKFWNNNRYKNDLVSDFVKNKIFFKRAYYIYSDQEIISDNIEEQKETYRIKKFTSEQQARINDLLAILQTKVDNWYVKIFNTLIVDSFEETKTRILQEIYWANLETRLKS